MRDDAVLAFRRADHDRHDAALEVEGDLVDLGEFGDCRRAQCGLGVRQHRAVEDVLQAGLEVAVQIGEREHAVVLAQHDVAVALEDRLGPVVSVPVLSVHSTSIAPRFWMALIRLTMTFLRPIATAPLRQADRHDHRQHLGRQAHGHGQREEEGLHPVALGQAVDENTNGTITSHEAQHEPGEAGDAAIEGRLRWRLLQGLRPCRPDTCPCPSRRPRRRPSRSRRSCRGTRCCVSAMGARGVCGCLSRPRTSRPESSRPSASPGSRTGPLPERSARRRESCRPRQAARRRPEPDAQRRISRGAPSRTTVAVTEIIALSLAAALSALASWTSFSPTLSAIIDSIMTAGPRRRRSQTRPSRGLPAESPAG